MPPTPAVLVTGASTGIGEACALGLAGAGYRVFAAVRRAEDGRRVEAADPSRIHPLLLDVTSPDQIASAAREVGDAVGEAGLAGLVNNAGIAVGGPLEFVPPDGLRRQLEVNVVGLHAVTVAFLPLIRRARGRIVNIGSIAGRIASPFTGPYAASKHAVEALTDSLRLELAPEGIHVSVVEPGQVRTPIWAKGLAEFARFAERVPPEGVARYAGRLKAFRWILERAPKHSVPPEVVAGAVLHALGARKPHTRYVIGRDARIRLALSRILSDRLMDSLTFATLDRLERRAR
jgi:NAD(P)-dependent dehydrogenase (short-subunit alcohol dehydrogenase family)